MAKATLRAGTWQPTEPSLLFIHDPRPRVIARSTASDRLVHMALTSLLEPVFEPSLMPEDLACPPDGGPHDAVLAGQSRDAACPWARSPASSWPRTST